MRVCILLISVLMSGTISGQSKQTLREKYGEPLSETFSFHDAIGLTVTYGSDGRLREMLIAPMRRDTLVRSRSITFTSELANRILDELVPLPSRGKSGIGGFINGFCPPENDCSGSSADYEKVSIIFNSARELGELCYVDVRFKP